VSHKSVFQEKANITQGYFYTPSETYPTIDDFAEAIETYAENAGIELELYCIDEDTGKMHWDFDTWSDVLIINERFNPAYAEDSGNTKSDSGVRFTGDLADPEFRATWEYHVREYLQALNVPFQITEEDDRFTFIFDNVEANATFRMVHADGYFDRKTKAKIADTGPIEPGLLPY
jgi:hypothetical protein